MTEFGERIFRWVPGHAQRVHGREVFDLTGFWKMLDIISLGSVVRRRERANASQLSSELEKFRRWVGQQHPNDELN